MSEWQPAVLLIALGLLLAVTVWAQISETSRLRGRSPPSFLCIIACGLFIGFVSYLVSQ
jgi:hypothetical protein